MRKYKLPLNIAHRGVSSLAPENTLPAFKKAIELKCSGIELDVHLTKDNQLVVIHDENLKRTTNGSGLVKNYNLNELKNLDAGSYFSDKFKNTKIPTLEEVILLIKPHNLLLDIEIKSPYPNIEKEILKLLTKHNYKNNSIITSFNPTVLKKIKQLDPSISTGLLFYFIQEDLFSIISNLNLNFICPDINYTKIIPNKYMNRLKKSNVGILTFTVDKKQDMIYLIKKHVTGIITNKPQLLNKLEHNPLYFFTRF